MALFALVVIAGSLQVGIGWGAEGPKAGFFPFYVGLLISGLERRQSRARSVASAPTAQLFAEWAQLGR